MSASTLPLLDRQQYNDLCEVFDKAMPQQLAFFTDTLSRDVIALDEQDDLVKLQAKAHEMAGAAATFGAQRLHEHLARIEAACKAGMNDEAMALRAELHQVWADTQGAFSAA